TCTSTFFSLITSSQLSINENNRATLAEYLENFMKHFLLYLIIFAPISILILGAFLHQGSAR
ncbi:TPA: hypothetical protein ACF2EK_004146, partial [Acinetobacter baumannii]